MECHLNDLRQKHPGKWRAAPVHPLLGADVCLSFKVEMEYRVCSFARTVQILSSVWLLTQSSHKTYFLARLPLHPVFIKEAQERKSRASGKVTGKVTGQVAIQVLRFCEQSRKASEIQALVGVKHRQTFRENYLNALIAKGWLERSIADKPRSRLQRYRTTEEGKKWAQECADTRPVA
jgi:hypothetical protein